MDYKAIELGRRLKELRGSNSQAKFSKKLGISATMLSYYERGERSPGSLAIADMAKGAGVSADWLLGLAEDQVVRAAPKRTKSIPVLSLAECGIKGWLCNVPLGITAAFPGNVSEKLFAVIAVGNSMRPAGIIPGHVLICDPDDSYGKGDAVYVETNDNRAAIKELVDMDDDWLTLKGWLGPDESGVQSSYEEQINWTVVSRLATVIYTKRKL